MMKYNENNNIPDQLYGILGQQIESTNKTISFCKAKEFI